jgi:hypothetical protein
VDGRAEGYAVEFEVTLEVRHHGAHEMRDVAVKRERRQLITAAEGRRQRGV